MICRWYSKYRIITRKTNNKAKTISFFFFQSRFASREELLLVHDESYLIDLEKLCASSESMTDDVKYQQSILEKKNSVYIHPQSYKSACIAAGSLLQVFVCSINCSYSLVLCLLEELYRS